MKIPIPDYLLENWLRHFQTLIEKGQFDRSDTKVANAVRLGRNDIIQLNKIIDKHKPKHDINHATTTAANNVEIQHHRAAQDRL